MHSHLQRNVVDISRCASQRTTARNSSYKCRNSCIAQSEGKRLTDGSFAIGIPCVYNRLDLRVSHISACRPARPRRTTPRIACLADGIFDPLALPRRLIKSLDFGLSRHDAEIFRLAIPALCSTLLDPLMGLVDTGMHLEVIS